MNDQYYTADPTSESKPVPCAFPYRGYGLNFMTDAGVFSKGELDVGSRLLLDALDRSGLSGVLVMRAVDHALSDLGVPIRFLPQNEHHVRQHATMFGVCGLLSMVMNWHKTGFATSVSEMAGIAVQLVTKPLFSEG